jgi:CRP-like cAMP-binding protein
MQLVEHPFIQTIPPGRLEQIIDEIEFREPQSETKIFAASTEPDAIYLILSGDVIFTREQEDGPPAKSAGPARNRRAATSN